MRIEMIGHASLLCETEDVRILMDPWIVGPANFDSWWHLPEVVCDPATLPPLDYVYISHLHGDHFHERTLARLLELGQQPTVLLPRLYHTRMVRRLRQLGFTRIRELPHAKEVPITGRTRVRCVQVGGDSMLAVCDGSAAMLNANDALQGRADVGLPALAELGKQYRFDMAFLAFGTAGPFPKCYRADDLSIKSMDPWLKERAMLSNFVKAAVTSGARRVVPFAGSFALLAERLLWMNEAKTTPADALEALKARAPAIQGVEMNPGDALDHGDGLIRNHPPIDWSRRLTTIRDMHWARAGEIARLDQAERRGPDHLYDLFRRRLSQNLRAFPLLRRRLNCCVLFDVEGEPGGQWEVDLRGPSDWFRQKDSGDWEMKVTIPARLLAEVLLDPDGWETLGISYKLNLHMRAGALAKESFLDRLIHTPRPLWLAQTIVKPRFAEFVLRRRREFVADLRAKLSGRG